MAAKPLPTADQLRQLLTYDADTGRLFWLPRDSGMFTESQYKGGVRSAHWAANTWNARWAGQEALTATDAGGYKVGSVLGKLLKAHRVAWALYNGHWLDAEVDHISGQRDDNRISNLRAVSGSMNRKNMGKPKDNTSGAIGVSWDIQTGRWRALIGVNGRSRCLGRYDTLAEAISARQRGELEAGFHSLHGKRDAFSPVR